MANELTTTIAATTDLAHANLARYAKDAQGAFAPNTVRALRADTAVFTAWCDTAGVPALPAAPQTVADFIDAMRAASKRPATIRRYVSSIAHRRWCTWRLEVEIAPNPRLLCNDRLATDGVWAPGGQHPVQHRHADGSLSPLGCKAAGSQPGSDQRLVATHCRFH